MLQITRLSKKASALRFITMSIALFDITRTFVNEFKVYTAVLMVVSLALIVKTVYTWISNVKESLSAAEWAVLDQA